MILFLPKTFNIFSAHKEFNSQTLPQSVFALNLPNPSELHQMKHAKSAFFHLCFSTYMFKDGLSMAYLCLSQSDDL